MSEDRDHIELGHTYRTTKRNYELLRIDEVSAATGKTINEVEEAMGMVAGSWEPDGEMEIEITVKQRMKRGDNSTPKPACTCTNDERTRPGPYLEDHYLAVHGYSIGDI